MQAHPHPGVLRLSEHGRREDAIRAKPPLFVRRPHARIMLNDEGQCLLSGNRAGISCAIPASARDDSEKLAFVDRFGARPQLRPPAGEPRRMGRG
jgi:hypothetical protein